MNSSMETFLYGSVTNFERDLIVFSPWHRFDRMRVLWAALVSSICRLPGISFESPVVATKFPAIVRVCACASRTTGAERPRPHCGSGSTHNEAAASKFILCIVGAMGKACVPSNDCVEFTAIVNAPRHDAL